jgi:di/tripeptidase
VTPFTDERIQSASLGHLQTVVAIDSQSDEHASAIPSTEGQRALAFVVAEHFAVCGASVEMDPHANVIATLPGRGQGAEAPPVALLVHLDTARGTANPPSLQLTRAWDGHRVPFALNPTIDVSVANYPGLEAFLGHDVVHGEGINPFGLDDKLGLTHLMTLAEVLAADPSIDHPPILFIGRPDEEIGRMAAVEGLADLLASRGVRSGYTIDGILPFEVNVANFNGAHATASWEGAPLDPARVAEFNRGYMLTFGGVNTHGATAHDEGHRAAVRLAAEFVAAARSLVIPVAFDSDRMRDCDGQLAVRIAPSVAPGLVEALLARVVGPHIRRGASFALRPLTALELAALPAHDGVGRMLASVLAFAAEATPSAPRWAEDSHGWLGYSHPYRARTTPHGVDLDVRIRDFDGERLAVRKAEVRAAFSAEGVRVTDHDQYVNMGPRMADRRDLVELALAAGRDVGAAVRELPIRGGTGVDPFLARGTAIANLGTGYFAPESEKELTSLQLMVSHVRWLTALMRRLAAVR